MALPPFNINQLVPADNDIVSQYPLTERLYRDIVESWFLIDGNNMGRKNKVSFDHQNTDPTGVEDVTIMWADDNGNLQIKNGTANTATVGNPLGTILEYSLPTLPEGYIWADGSAVTSTYPEYRAALIDAGNPYGTDGINPLRPDRRERVGAGRGTMGGTSSPARMDSATTLGGTQGTKAFQLEVTHMPSHNHTINITDPGHVHGIRYFILGMTSGGIPILGSVAHFGESGPALSDTAYTGITAASVNTGGNTAHNNVQPTIILNYIIRAY